MSDSKISGADALMLSLAQSAGDGTTEIIGHLSAVRNATNDLTALSQRFSDGFALIGETAVEPDSNAAITDMLSDVSSRVRASIGGLDAARAETLWPALKSAGRAMLQLRVIGILLNIESRRNGDGTLRAFADQFRDLTLNLDAAVIETGKTAKNVIAAVDGAVAAIGETLATAGSHIDTLRDQQAKLAEAEERRNVVLQTSRDQTATLSHSCNHDIQRLVPCMQFADALYQRLDNAAKIMAEGEARGGSMASAARWLALEHLRGLRDDTREMSGSVEASLESIHKAAFRLHHDLFGSGDRFDVAQEWLVVKSRHTALARDATQELSGDLQGAFEKFGAAVELGGDLTERIKDFRDLTLSLEIAAVNGSIAGARSARAPGGTAVTVHLAAEVKQSSQTCAAYLIQSGETLIDLHSRVAGIDREGLTATLKDIGTIHMRQIAELKLQKVTLQDQAAIMDGIRAAISSLMESCKGARDIGRRLQSLEYGLDQLLAMHDDTGRRPDDGGSLEWARDIVTTVEERALHASLLGQKETTESIYDDETADDLASFLM